MPGPPGGTAPTRRCVRPQDNVNKVHLGIAPDGLYTGAADACFGSVAGIRVPHRRRLQKRHTGPGRGVPISNVMPNAKRTRTVSGRATGVAEPEIEKDNLSN